MTRPTAAKGAYPVGDSYFVTRNGEVFTEKGRTPRPLKPYRSGSGYKAVALMHDGKKVRRYVHRIVAEAFIPNPDGYPVVRHLDGNPANNAASNLAWGTHLDNQDDTVRHGRAVRRLSTDDHCLRGHATSEFGRRDKRGWLSCRACENARMRLWRAA